MIPITENMAAMSMAALSLNPIREKFRALQTVFQSLSVLLRMPQCTIVIQAEVGIQPITPMSKYGIMTNRHLNLILKMPD